MDNNYQIIKNRPDSYGFITRENIEYELVIKPSGIAYLNKEGKQKNVIELALNCDFNSANKDYKTVKTIIFFCKELSQRLDAVYIQMHNQPELINNKTKRRGLSRIKLWSRIINKHFKEYVFLTNQILDPHKDRDILCIAIKKDSIYYKQIVTNFYRFRYAPK